MGLFKGTSASGLRLRYDCRFVYPIGIFVYLFIGNGTKSRR